MEVTQRALSLLMLIAVLVSAADREVEGLLDRARGVPPEFAADALLRIAKNAKLVPAREQRIDIVEEAFRLAALAQMPWPVIGRGYHTDTRPGWREFAGDTELNSLDLQARSIAMMQGLDATRLRRMFSEMRPLDLQPGTCKDPMRPRLKKYYETMMLVAEYGFTADDKRKGSAEQFIQEQLRAIVSPSQLSAAVWLAMKGGTPARLNALAIALPNVHHDWLAFVYGAEDMPWTPETARVVREYIVRSMRGPRCSGKYEPLAAELFNTYIVKKHPALQMERIDASSLEPSRIDDKYVLEEFWKSDKSKQVQHEVRWLYHGHRNLPGDKRFWTLEERKTPEWNERYLAFLKLMDSWSASDEPSPADYFHMRAHVYVFLTRVVPPGAQRTNAIRNLISWMHGAYNDRIPHAEWFTHIRHLFRDMKEEPWIIDEIEQHGNAVLSLYARLNRLGLWSADSK